MSDFATYLKKAIQQADKIIDKETTDHRQRMEFWRGYKSAMSEIAGHPEYWQTNGGDGE